MSGSPFDDVHLRWGGKDHTIPANRVMGAIKRVEDHYSLNQIQRDIARNDIKTSKVAAAFAELLRYAGERGVTEEQVYDGMFGSREAQETVMDSVILLLVMMIPKSGKIGGDAKPGEA